MKRKISRELSVGFIFLIAMLILGYYTIIMSSRFLEPKNSYIISVIFPTIEGLSVENKVKVNGVELGRVKDIQLAGYQVWVKLKMFKDFTLYENFSIKIKSDALLGKKFVSIFPGTPIGKDGIEQGVVILREKLPGKYEDTISSINEVIEDNRENIYVSIRNLREITSKINRGQGTIGKLINEDNIHAQTDELVKELRETIEDAREQAPITSFIRAALTAF